MELSTRFVSLVSDLAIRETGRRSGNLLHYLVFIVNTYIDALEDISSKERFPESLSADFRKATKNLEINSDISIYRDFEKDYKRDFEKISYSDFRAVCTSLIKAFLVNRRHSVSFSILSDEANAYIASLLEPKENLVVFNPACGAAFTFLKLLEIHPEHSVRFVGQEFDPEMHLIGLVNLLIHGVHNAEIRLENSLEGPPSTIRGKIDVSILAIPNEPLPTPSRSADHIFIDSMLVGLSSDGRGVAVVRDIFLTNDFYKGERENYIKRGWIESITSLPLESVAPSLRLKSSIIVFNKAKREQSVRFRELDSNFNVADESTIDRAQIAKHGFRLNANRYVNPNRQQLTDFLRKSPYRVVRLKDLAISSERGENYSSPQRTGRANAGAVPYVRTADLAKDDTNLILAIDSVQKYVAPDFIKKEPVKQTAILASLIGGKLRATFFEFQGQEILIATDVLAIFFPETNKGFQIDIKYILTQLRSNLVQTQVEMALISRNAINRISPEDLLRIEIPLPKIEEQRRQVLELGSLLSQRSRAEKQIVETSERITQTEYDVVATISHNLNQKFGSITEDYDSLIRFLERKERTGSRLDFAQLLRPLDKDERNDTVDTLAAVVERLRRNLKDTTETLKRTEDIIQKSQLNIASIDIIQFFKSEIKPDFENHNFEIAIIESKPIQISLDVGAFKDALQNLIENAKRHGFTDPERTYNIVFELSKYESPSGDSFLRILYKNNGNPFPKGFGFEEYKRLGGRAGQTRATGLGGFFINKVIDLHGGRFSFVEIDPTSIEPFKVQFEILLPLSD